jgi:hypothetical protein
MLGIFLLAIIVFPSFDFGLTQGFDSDMAKTYAIMIFGHENFCVEAPKQGGTMTNCKMFNYKYYHFQTELQVYLAAIPISEMKNTAQCCQ